MKQFESLRASELYCPRCKRMQRVNERLMLVLPNGELKAYRCEQCGETLGTHEENSAPPGDIIIA